MVKCFTDYLLYWNCLENTHTHIYINIYKFIYIYVYKVQDEKEEICTDVKQTWYFFSHIMSVFLNNMEINHYISNH